MSKICKNIVCFSLFLLIFCVFLPANCVFAVKAADVQDTGKEAICVIEANSGRVLFEQNADVQKPMASTTKILTCLLVLNNCKNLDAFVTVPDEAVGVEGSSLYLRKGDRLTYRDLLYGMMLCSGNDAAVALSILTAGSVENFIQMCNTFCEEQGFNNTHLVTTNGLDDPAHYTTARDLAHITCLAFKNETFTEIVGSKYYTMEGQRKGTKEKVLKNKNKLLSTYEGADGVKTRYTTKAGKCFVGSAKRNGMHLVGAFLQVSTMFDRCAQVFDELFNKYEMTSVLPAYAHLGSVQVKNGDKAFIHIVSKQPFTYPLSIVEKSLLIVKYRISSCVKAPIFKDQVIGKVEIYLGNDLIFSAKIYTMEHVESNTFFATLQKILQQF